MPPPADVASAWGVALRSLEALAESPDATPADLRQVGAGLWLALTGETFVAPPPGDPLPWAKLDAAGLTPALGAVPVLLARILTADPDQIAPSAAALLETLNVLASLRPAVQVCPAEMPSQAPASALSPPPAPPEGRLPVPTDGELWTRSPARLTAPNRRRRNGWEVLHTLILLVAGGLGGFFGGALYEKTHGPAAASATATAPAPTTVAEAPTPTPVPDVPLPPSPPVGAAAVAARLQTIRARQPDVGDILKYAREFRRVATLPVADPASFPSEGQFNRLVERFDWNRPDSPNAHRTPLLVVLGYADDPALSSKGANQLAQVLTQSGITSPIYTCGMGPGQAVPEVEKAGVGTDGKFVEVWVAFTLF